MNVEPSDLELDATDLQILELLQENCKRPLAAIGEAVGLTAPSVADRIHHLEEAGVIRGYVALVEARAVGRDVTAFVGISVSHPRDVAAVEEALAEAPEVLECHHVTGPHTLLVKVKTESTRTLEELIDRVRSLEGVTATETTVVLSTHVERTRVPIDVSEAPAPRRARRGAGSRVRRAAQSA